MLLVSVLQMDSWSYGTSFLPSDSFPENPRSLAQGLSNEFDKVDDRIDFKVRSFMDYGNYDGSRAKKPRASSSSPLCQVHGCNMDLSSSKDYHKRHRVCEAHSKTSVVIVNGVEQRFCQQCSRFHFLSEFDNGKRSCRRRLAGHNERRRKPSFYFRHKLLPQGTNSLAGNKVHGRLVSFKDEPMFPAENMSFYSPEAAASSGVSSIWDLHEAGPPRSTCAHSLLSAQSQQCLSETNPNKSFSITQPNQTLNHSTIGYHQMQPPPLRTVSSSTVDLQQLSSHLQRIEQQQRSFTNDDVKQEYNNELYFP